MHNFTRPELETDPDCYPGQIVNPIPRAMYLRDIIARIEAEEEAFDSCRLVYPADTE